MGGGHRNFLQKLTVWQIFLFPLIINMETIKYFKTHAHFAWEITYLYIVVLWLIVRQCYIHLSFSDKNMNNTRHGNQHKCKNQNSVKYYTHLTPPTPSNLRYKICITHTVKSMGFRYTLQKKKKMTILYLYKKRTPKSKEIQI